MPSFSKIVHGAQTIYPGHRVLDYYASRRHLQRLLRPRRLPTTSLQPTKNAELFAIHGGRLLRCRDLEARRKNISPRMPSSAMRPLDKTTHGLQAHRARRWTATRTKHNPNGTRLRAHSGIRHDTCLQCSIFFRMFAANAHDTADLDNEPYMQFRHISYHHDCLHVHMYMFMEVGRDVCLLKA